MSTATGCYLCHQRKSRNALGAYKKAPANSIDFTLTECDIEDSVRKGGRASIVHLAAPAGYGQVTQMELDGEDEDDDEEEEEEMVIEVASGRTAEEKEEDCVALNV